MSKSDLQLLVAGTRDGPVFEGCAKKLFCYGCEGALAWRKAHKRTHCGVEIPVRGHFMHVNRPDGCAVSKETIEHLAAKHMVKITPVTTYILECVTCKVEIPVETAEEGSTAHEEYSWKRGDKRYQFDVAFVTDGRVTGAVEVYQTHRIPHVKAKDMTDAGIAWVEVRATDVLERRGVNVPVLLCAHAECDSCAVAREERLAAIKKRELVDRQKYDDSRRVPYEWPEVFFVARTDVGPVTSTPDGVSICYGCDQPVFWRDAGVHTKCGLSRNFPGHFDHPTLRHEACTNDETMERAAKDLIARDAHLTYAVACRNEGCEQKLIFEMPHENATTHADFSWVYGGRAYPLDVAFVRDEQVVGAIFILKGAKIASRPLSDARVKDFLTDAGVEWVEVVARDVVVVGKTGENVAVRECANDVCQECDNLRRERVQKDRHEQEQAHQREEVSRLAQARRHKAAREAAREENERLRFLDSLKVDYEWPEHINVAQIDTGSGFTDAVVSEADRDKVPICYGCKYRLFWHDGKDCVKFGVSYYAPGHYAHKTPRTRECTNDIIHERSAKDIIRNDRHASTSLEYAVMCCYETCQEKIIVRMPYEKTKTHVDYMWCHKHHEYRLDVAFVKDKRVVGAVVFERSDATQNISESLSKVLTDADVAWVRVEAHEVIARTDETVKTLACAFKVCQTCSKVKRRLEEQEDRKSAKIAPRSLD